MTTEELCAWQDHILEHHRTVLQREGKLVPMLFVLAYDKLVDRQWAQSMKIQLDSNGTPDRVKTFAEVIDASRGRIVELLTPLIEQAVPVQLAAIEAILSPEQRKPVEELKRSFPPGVPEYQRALLEALKRALGIKDEQYIELLCIKEFLRRTRALAYCRLGEGYIAPATTPRPTGSLKDVAEAVECITVSMETGKIGRVLVQPFHRKVRDIGEVTGFEPVREQQAKVEHDSLFGGLLPSDESVIRGV